MRKLNVYYASLSLSAFCWPNQVGQQMVHLSLQKGFSGVSWNLYNNWAVDTGTETSYNSPREIKKRGNETIFELHAFRAHGICIHLFWGFPRCSPCFSEKHLLFKLLNIMQTSKQNHFLQKKMLQYEICLVATTKFHLDICTIYIHTN